jgi:hypothetical protein
MERDETDRRMTNGKRSDPGLFLGDEIHEFLLFLLYFLCNCGGFGGRGSHS